MTLELSIHLQEKLRRRLLDLINNITIQGRDNRDIDNETYNFYEDGRCFSKDQDGYRTWWITFSVDKEGYSIIENQTTRYRIGLSHKEQIYRSKDSYPYNLIQERLRPLKIDGKIRTEEIKREINISLLKKLEEYVR